MIIMSTSTICSKLDGYENTSCHVISLVRNTAGEGRHFCAYNESKYFFCTSDFHYFKCISI